ncbi:LOW QUALITY PROTEIN: unconventional myosin-XVIIIa-like [Liolophura sinensis]|uniref:LOW QUALITY PROTEIN: unconventional myosin-XVIIIa-like n=1 Tax=Liolophura sinensis TaxID=3198878 RepID=UPI0031594568
MFSFMKKDKDREKEKDKKEKKEKEKKDKKEKKEKTKERQGITQEELNRLEEVKKGVFRRFSDRDKSRKRKEAHGEGGSGDGTGIPTDSSDSSLSSNTRLSPSQELPDSQMTAEKPVLSKPVAAPRSHGKSSHKEKMGPPPVMPKPNKSILRGGSAPVSNSYHQNGNGQNGDDSNLLQTNTKLNEQMSGPTSSASRKTIPQINEPSPDVIPAQEDVIDSPVEKTFKADLQLPEIIPPKAPKSRTVSVKRQPGGDFGFTLRKGVMMDGDRKRNVIFAEPGGGTRGSLTGLLPGDRLVEVNNVNVENKTREEVVELIRTSGDHVTLRLQPIPELIELSVRPGSDGATVDVGEHVVKGGTLKRSGSMRYKKAAKSEDEVLSEKAWLDAEQVWLVHKGGFAGARLLKSNTSMSPIPEGRVKIKLEQNGEVLEVDEDDIEKANPPQFDKSEDLAALRYLNESSVLHTLRQRFGTSLIHTYAGTSLLVINPTNPLSIYSEKVIQMFKGCKQEDLPPHVYASAQIAYREMLSSRRDQSIVLMGRSGSGKTTNLKHVLNYLTVAAGTVGNVFTVSKLNAINTLLEAFGNSRTILNTNASRFTQVTSLDFDHAGQIVSASIQALMFEKSRLVRRPEGEPTFHVFYQLLAGVDSELRKELQLTVLNEPNIFMTPLQRNEDRQKAAAQWAKIQNAFDTLNFTDMESKAIFSVLAAIYHLGVASAVKGNNNKSQFARPASAQRAAALLGTSVEEMARMIFIPSMGGTLTRNQSFRSSPGDRSGGDNSSAVECLEGFVIGLYSDVFNAVVSLINRSLSSNYRSLTSLTLLDMPGFQNPSSCGRSGGATFEDLCYNYSQERLQLLFHDLTFTSQQDRYSQENIECDFEFVTSSPQAMVSLIDKHPAQTLVRGTGGDHSKDIEKKGLLWLLDEEAIFPGASDDSFMERLFTHHGEQKARKDSLLRKGSLGAFFMLSHFQGTNTVQYNATGWLRMCRENPITRVATAVLQDSSRPELSQLFTSVRGPVSSTVSGSIVGIDGSSSLRRASSMRRTFTSGQAGLKRKSVCLQVKFQMDSIIDTLRKTKCHFVHCLLPQANAGLCELKSAQSPAKSSGQEDLTLSVPLLRSQIRGAEMVEAIRIHRQGFPEFIPFKDFKTRFHVLLPNDCKINTSSGDDRQVVSQMLDYLDVDKLNYRIGLSQVFFRSGALTSLELQRDEKITGTMQAFQALCRGYLGRKQLAKLRVQHMAIRAIQVNVKNFMQIRDWGWWRLFTKVKPLLNVHRTEEETQEQQVELEQMKMKSEKLERERNELKQHCDKLETRLSEMTADLAEENTTSSHAAEMLEVETAERMRLEKELKDLQAKYTAVKRQCEKHEMELMQSRLWQASLVEGDLEDDIDGNDSVYKDRYERIVRELDVTRKRLQHQHNENLEQEQNSRKQVERRLHEAQEEVEEQRRLVTATKKKCQRLTSEMQDLKLHLEEQMSRNNDLEKKQRRFDAELHKVQEDVRGEKMLREKLQRERDELISERMSLETSIGKLKADLESQTERSERLDRELSDLTLTGPKGDQELMALKRQKHELELKVKEQEEELDDQAGHIQQLEQGKLRLEMQQEKSRQQHIKDLDEKETELEEMRYTTQKRLKNLESQIEEDYEERQNLMREKREVELKLQELTSRAPNRDKEHEKRLRRDLRRTKVLLRDAETMLQKQRSGEGTKATIRQLRNQLEDAEFTSAAAVKAKKAMEIEVQELQQQLEDVSRAKQEVENRCIMLLRDKSDLESKMEENEEDTAEIMKKYKAVVQQHSVDSITLSDRLQQIEELASERNMLREQVSELSTKVQLAEDSTVDKHVVTRLETKIRDLESKLELEVTTKTRLETQIVRYKDAVEKLSQEKEDLASRRMQTEEVSKRSQKQLRDLREEFTDTQRREMEASQRKQELETRIEELETDYEQSQSDLKLAFKRIADLQAALEDDMDSDDSLLLDSDDDDEDDSEDDGQDLATFIKNNTGHSSRSRSYGSSVSSQYSKANSSFTELQPDSPVGILLEHNSSTEA